jgi:hypothetical protein
MSFLILQTVHVSLTKLPHIFTFTWSPSIMDLVILNSLTLISCIPTNVNTQTVHNANTHIWDAHNFIHFQQNIHTRTYVDTSFNKHALPQQCIIEIGEWWMWCKRRPLTQQCIIEIGEWWMWYKRHPLTQQCIIEIGEWWMWYKRHPLMQQCIIEIGEWWKWCKRHPLTQQIEQCIV